MSNVTIQGKLDTDRTRVQEIYADEQGNVHVAGGKATQQTSTQLAALVGTLAATDDGELYLSTDTGGQFANGVTYRWNGALSLFIPRYYGGEVIPLTDASGDTAFSAAETGTWILSPAAVCTFEARLSATTTPTATVEIHGTNFLTATPGAGTLLGTITLSGSADIASFTKSSAAYRYKCAKVTAISGTSATCTVTMGV